MIFVDVPIMMSFSCRGRFRWRRQQDGARNSLAQKKGHYLARESQEVALISKQQARISESENRYESGLGERSRTTTIKQNKKKKKKGQQRGL